MVGTDFDSEREYDDESFSAQKVCADEKQKTILGYFEPEQFIPVHSPESTLTVVVLEGGGMVRDGDKEHGVVEGSVVVVPAGEKRGIRAGENGLEAALVTSPPPTEEDHEKVHEGLERGVFEP